MEGRWPNGLAMIFGNADDPANEPEVNKWYVETQIPDVTNPGIFPICTRYENPSAKGGGRAAQVRRRLRDGAGGPRRSLDREPQAHGPLRDQGRISPHMKASLVSIYKKVGTLRPPARRAAPCWWCLPTVRTLPAKRS